MAQPDSDIASLTRGLSYMKIKPRWFQRLTSAINDESAHRIWEFCMADITDAGLIELNKQEWKLARELLNCKMLPKKKRHRFEIYYRFFSAWLAVATDDKKSHAQLAIKELNIHLGNRIKRTVQNPISLNLNID